MTSSLPPCLECYEDSHAPCEYCGAPTCVACLASRDEMPFERGERALWLCRDCYYAIYEASGGCIGCGTAGDSPKHTHMLGDGNNCVCDARHSFYDEARPGSVDMDEALIGVLGALVAERRPDEALGFAGMRIDDLVDDYLQSEVVHAAYPEGTPDDFEMRTRRIVNGMVLALKRANRRAPAST